MYSADVPDFLRDPLAPSPNGRCRRAPCTPAPAPAPRRIATPGEATLLYLGLLVGGLIGVALVRALAR